MSNTIQGVSKVLNKISPQKRLGIQKTGVGNFIDPAARVADNLANGGAVTPKSILDPAEFVLKRPPGTPPGPPTIDEAQRQVYESDRMRKRRGVYANIYAGNAAAPSVGKATLGG